MATIFIYFTLFRKNKNLHYIPKNADYVLLIDIKSLMQTYLWQYTVHPSEWLKKSKKNNQISLTSSGIKIPDFVQIFHLKNTRFNEWYAVLDIKDEPRFLKFISQEKFIKQGEKIYTKENIYLEIIDSQCYLGIGNPQTIKNFNALHHYFQQSLHLQKVYNAKDFIGNSHGSFSSISGDKILSLPIVVNDDHITVGNPLSRQDFAPLISSLQQENQTIHIELDQKNINLFKKTLKEKSLDSLAVKKISGIANVEMVNDTIVSYTFDDHFNEIKKISYQKIIQPNYIFNLSSDNPQEIWTYFQNKKWMNAKKELVIIPFLPNAISQNNNGLQIVSTRKKMKDEVVRNRNFIFFKNNSLLINSLKSLSPEEKSLLSNVDYLFYGNERNIPFVELKFRPQDRPLILRF